ncbi:MAG: hypothetical protein AAF919_17250 [Pseudomonadota bacterium]
MRTTLSPMTIRTPAVTLTCDRCPMSKDLPRLEFLRRVGPYTSLEVALAVLSRGCEGDEGVCGLRFVGVGEAQGVRSVLNRRGTGFTRSRDHTTPPETWKISYDGWRIGRVSLVAYGPRQGEWTWTTWTHPPKSGQDAVLEDALAAIKEAAVLDEWGRPMSDEAFLFSRRAGRTAKIGAAEAGGRL